MNKMDKCYRLCLHFLHLDRQSLIQYKNKDQSDLFKNKIIISMKYDQNYSNIKKLLYSSWNKNNEIHTDINLNNKNKNLCLYHLE